MVSNTHDHDHTRASGQSVHVAGHLALAVRPITISDLANLIYICSQEKAVKAEKEASLELVRLREHHNPDQPELDFR
jgi:hypothetical protein